MTNTVLFFDLLSSFDLHSRWSQVLLFFLLYQIREIMKNCFFINVIYVLNVKQTIER